jgi:ABC-type bacteriocin/lantibiotic exporter with double-glycine peptidase domain
VNSPDAAGLRDAPPRDHAAAERPASRAPQPGRRRLLAPEVVQTSAMDCGPAALKCLLEGHAIPASYGRLREACQTGVDGTSIDALEEVANRLGLAAEQVMIPPDHVFLAEARALPALVVVRQPDGALHFVVAWRRHGPWVQLMDPALGRRWVRWRGFTSDLFRHRLPVSAQDWRAWAESDDFLLPLGRRIAGLGAEPAACRALVERALAYPGWFGLAALDAATRLAESVARADGVRRQEAGSLLEGLFERTCSSPDDIFTLVPPAYWSALPAPEEGKGMLAAHGAVLLRIQGRAHAAGAVPDTDADADADAEALPPELAAALAEAPASAVRALWSMLREDGLLAPLAVLGASLIAAGAATVETLLFRGIFDLGGELRLPSQRLQAAGALLAFCAIMLLLRVPVATEGQRLGRRLEARLRMALLRKLPLLPDRYFHSRPISDMADRSHAIHMLRQLPAMGLQAVQCVAELALTLGGIALIAPASAPVACLMALVAAAVPLALQPLLGERDLRARSQGSALNSFYLDALLGLAPIRAHNAAQAVRRQHEGLLVGWLRSSRSLMRLSLLAEAAQSLACLALAGILLVRHFLDASAVTGADLLLVYWTLKLPGLGRQLAGLARRYPAQRNTVLRLLEPLATPTGESTGETTEAPAEAPTQAAAPGKAAAAAAVRIDIAGGDVRAAGHVILDGLDLHIGPGEHVAVVGVSGAGKSSLLGLLLGWHRLGRGELAVDGAALDGAALDALRRRTAWVDPAVQVWNRSLLDNLRYSSRDEALGRVGEALDVASLRQVLEKLPQGLQALLGEGGALLSGGEGQRVRLARALAQRDVGLALLDEPFRGLDREQRARLMAEARRWWRGATMLCVTHDVGETLGFGRVLVVEDGRIVEDGAPAELAAGATRYRSLLEAETSVRSRMWNGAHWRRIEMRGGLVAAGGGA